MYSKFIEILRLLASNANIQLSKIPSEAVRPDEIAFFSEEAVLICKGLYERGDVSINIYESVIELDQIFFSFDEKEWSEQAVRLSPKWQEIREKSKKILIDLNEFYELPNLFWVSNIF